MSTSGDPSHISESGSPWTARRKALLGAAIVLVVVLVTHLALYRHADAASVSRERAHAAEHLREWQHGLAASVERRLSLLDACSAFLLTRQADPDARLGAFAEGLAAGANGASRLLIAPGGTVREVYPPNDHSGMLGRDLLGHDRLEIRADVERARRTGTTTITDGRVPGADRHAMYGWKPIIRDGSFWGVVGIEMRASTLFEDSWLGPAEQDAHTLAVRTATGEVVWGDPSLFSMEPALARVEIPDGYWEIAAAPAGGWMTPSHRRLLLYFRLTWALIGMLVAGLTYLVIARQARLNDGVMRRTTELFTTNTDLAQEAEMHRHTQVELSAATERFRLLYDNAPVGLLKTRISDGAIIETNLRQAQLFGYDDVEEFKRDFRAAESYVDPTDRERLLAELQRTGYMHDFEAQHARRDGSLVWVRGTVRLNEADQTIDGYVADVTHEKANAQALKESEERFKSFFENSTIGLYRTTPDGRILLANPEMLEMWGLASIEGAMSSGIDSVCSEAGYPRDQFLKTIERDGAVIGYETPWTLADGSVRYLRESARAVRDADGKTLYIEGAVEDISERTLAETALVDSENRYRNLVENMDEIVFALDASGDFTFISPTVERFSGAPPERFVGRHFSEFVHPDDLSGLTDSMERALNGHPESHEFRVLHADGRALHVHASGYPLVQGKRTIGLSGIMADITERRESEQSLQRLSTAIDQTGEAVVITGADGDIVYVNPAFENITGYSREEIVGEQLAILDGGEQDNAHVREMWEAVEAGQTWQGRISNRRKDGELLEEDVTVSPVRDAEGRIVNYVRVSHDTTQQTAMDNRLRQGQKMEAIGRLASGVAHDFNNLLTVITNCAELMESDVRESERSMALLSEISGAANRAAELTGRLLTFGKKADIRPSLTDLSEVVRETARLLRRVLTETIDLRMAPDPEVSPVMADRGQIEQILLNLATNARDAMPDGGTLAIETRNVSFTKRSSNRPVDLAPGEYVSLTTTDTGAGMDEETAARIFEPFFSTKGDSGTGLGLATVYGIVTQHGGHIWCESRLGRGTTFSICLPAAEDRPAAPEPTQAAEVVGGTEVILVVEDEPAILTVASKLLEHHGYTVLQAVSGEKALEVAASHDGRIHLLLTDVVMPDRSGPELATLLLESRPDIAVVYTSGYADDLISDHGLLKPGISFLHKPYNLHELLGMIRSALTESGA